MNKAKLLVNIIEKILKMGHIDYQEEPYGPIHFGGNSKESWDLHKKYYHDTQEYLKTDSMHKQLKTEARKQYGAKDLSKENAVKRYTGGAYHIINRHLRHGEEIGEGTSNMIKNLKNLTRNETKHGFTVYRSSRTRLVDSKPGEMFQDHGFTSTSLMPRFAVSSFGNGGSQQQNFRIHVTPGTRGHYVSAHKFSLGEGSEKEFLLHPGTKFRVGETFTHPNGNTYTDLHIHSQED